MSSTLRQVHDLHVEWHRRRMSATDARRTLVETIMRARADGHSLAAIGEAMGVSRQYIHQLVKESEA